MHNNHKSYFHHTSKSRLDKTVNTLLGIIEGIAIDARINAREIEFLHEWVNEHQRVRKQHPFDELVPVVEEALEDGILSEDEHQDIVWLCEKLTSQKYFDRVTVDLQRLHAIMGGILADGVVIEKELEGLSAWLSEHAHLKKCYPYDEVDSIILDVMADKIIDAKEQEMLRRLFSEFIQVCDDRIIKNPPVYEDSSIEGLCAVCPEITFDNSWFCFTGVSQKRSRKDLANIVTQLGGKVTNSVRQDLNYLVIGAEGNPCWAYACYGRKVEKAVNLRKKGAQLLIVHEYDFHDAVRDLE